MQLHWYFFIIIKYDICRLYVYCYSFITSTFWNSSADILLIKHKWSKSQVNVLLYKHLLKIHWHIYFSRLSIYCYTFRRMLLIHLKDSILRVKLGSSIKVTFIDILYIYTFWYYFVSINYNLQELCKNQKFPTQTLCKKNLKKNFKLET